MFKLESYITPILLSYVDKYIKNFRPEDSQVSLWGGDASFHNLDLRLEVLEQELQLPFSFVSGHIHELLIHVPWTKLASEPILITINTIECILKLRGSESSPADKATQLKERQKRGANKKQNVEAPPGYVQFLINKIVSNIRIYCNNLILKYVEEDIVLSMNVKLLTFESADEKWQPAYTDVFPASAVQRKLIAVNDLTVCLDKRNASGKIDVYQEPMLYRCSMIIHFLQCYHGASKNSSTTRFDIYCNSMEFSMTEQQIPMLLRLIFLLQALQQKQLKSDIEVNREMDPIVDPTGEFLNDRQTLASWAWSFVPSILPALDEEAEEQQIANLGHTMHIGFYVDNASLTFKVSESINEKSGYYSQRKFKYWPLLTLKLQGIFMDCIMHGKQWVQLGMGISEMLLLPLGHCSCSTQDVFDSVPVNEYLKAGCDSSVHKSESLFDAEAPENKAEKRIYNTNWDRHLEQACERVLLERSPAFAIDYIYQLVVPDDMSSENLSELGSDLEYSNLSERALLRVVVGPLRLRLCSGFLHRISSLQAAASAYDYIPYSIPKPEPELGSLPPPSEDDYDALNENIPTRSMQITIFAPIIEFQLMDHPHFEAVKGYLFKKRRKVSSHSPPSNSNVELPKITLECQMIDVKVHNPMYTKRLLRTTCQLPDPPKKMFDACHTVFEMKVLSLRSRLVINGRQTTILTPSNATFNSKKILMPQYWVNPNIAHEEINLESESITFTGTYPKIVIIAHILDKMMKIDCEDSLNYILNSSILQDATRNVGLVYLELCIEGINFRKVTTNSTTTIDAKLGSIKAFIFEPPDISQIKQEVTPNSNASYCSAREIQQVLIISGPELEDDYKTANVLSEPLFTVTMQFPLNPELQTHPPILIFNLREIRICIDPLLCRWMLYTPKTAPPKTEVLFEAQPRKLSRSYSDISTHETPRRSRTPYESIHSSFEQGTNLVPKTSILKDDEENEIDLQEKTYNFLKKWFDVWKGLLVFGDVSQCTLYFPVKSLSAVGSQGIQQAVEEAMRKDFPPDIFIFTLPSSTIRNSAHREALTKFLTVLPVSLPEYLWTKKKSSFPWSITISDLCCYTWQHGERQNCLAPVSLTSTVGMSTRCSKINIKDARKGSSDYKSVENMDISFPSNKNDIGSLGICIHIDTTPVVISVSEIQVCLIASILNGLLEVISNIMPDPYVEPKQSETIPNVPSHSSVISPTLLKESVETMSEKTPHVYTDTIETENIKLTAWIQWTITKFSVELLAHDSKDISVKDFKYSKQPKLKFVIDAEDIVSSLDFQSVYLKLKSKIGTASVMHYIREKHKWQPGDFLGFVMRANEDPMIMSDRQEDTSFANITVTRASCQHTHNLWGTNKKSKSADKNDDGGENQSHSRYISEIVINLQPIDVLVSPTTLKNYFLVLEPLLRIPSQTNAAAAATNIVQLSNRTLPLVYLEFHGFRVIMPSVQLGNQYALHNTCIFQINKINLTPSAVNPICRSPCRPDIYQQAAQARILNVPGSDVEDRQYQLDIVGISMNTGTWDEISQILKFHGKNFSVLRTMSENPALEWNSLGKHKLSNMPDVKFWPLIAKFDISIVAAPAMIYKHDVICGHSVEVNFISDIKITLSLSQIKLLLSLLRESSYVFDILNVTKNNSKRPKVIFPYPQCNLDAEYDEVLDVEQVQDVTRDSGFETSDLRSSFSVKTKESSYLRKATDLSEKSGYTSVHASPVFGKSILMTTQTFVPLDMLLTGGKVSLVLYEYEKDPKKIMALAHLRRGYESESEKGYEASEEGSSDERPHTSKFTPLFYIALSQPNAFLSDTQIGRKIQISCFDISIKISGADRKALRGIPTEEDYQINLLETKSGEPNPDTGVLPAFFTMKWSKGIGKLATLDLEIAKPTKILCSISRCMYLMQIQEKIIENFDLNVAVPNVTIVAVETEVKPSERGAIVKVSDYYSKFKEIKERFMGITVFNIKLSQFILTVQTDHGIEVTLSFSRLHNHLTISNRPERLVNLTTIDCLAMGVSREKEDKLLLNPWTVTFEITLFWESWQNSNSNPQLQLTADSDCIVLDVSPDKIICLQVVIEQLQHFINNLPIARGPRVAKTEVIRVPYGEKEQHYKDDLRAGAFQFVDSTGSNIDELPLPYQVMFWNRNVSAMAWRYPQPRALTKVRIFPVPFKISTGTEEEQQVLCHLEYWSDCHGGYQSYSQFYLSETDMCHLELPNTLPQPAVACTWRVVLTTPCVKNSTQSKVLISPRALAGCIRVDSYFNKNLIPELTIALHIGAIHINLFNYFDKKANYNLPSVLANYTPDLFFPDYQQFLTLSIENANIYLATWNLEMAVFDINATTKCSILDYGFLTQQLLVEPFASKLEISVSKTLGIHFLSKPIHVLFGASAAHTLAVSAQLWAHCFQEGDVLDFVVMTNYIICNDTNVNLRFGQNGMEDIFLPSRYCHLYAWRSQKCKQTIRVAFEENRWVWSEPFKIDCDGTEICKIADQDAVIIVTVKSLSATQKQVIFSGQLIVCNTLLEHFEMKILEEVDNRDKDREFKIAQSHIVRGRSTPPSMLIDGEKRYYLRLRFFGLESAWSGDIPLMENTKCAQPWLVKVPLQERGQFLSIWCRIVMQKFAKGTKILAILWPLFMIRSNLPISAKVHIETPTLNVHLESTIRGMGEYQQLYCPGTIDHSHQLTFQLDNNMSSSNPYVPLNYSLVDQKQFFKKSDREDINEILAVIDNYQKLYWPYFKDQDEEIEFTAEEQPLTHVQVRYQNACQYSSALLVELLPWSLLTNTLGCSIAIIVNENELCRINHLGIVTPPKLEETFYIGVGIGSTWNMSHPLQLAKSNWGQTFYMPQITGTIPVEGFIKSVVKCDPYVSVLSITSTMLNEIRCLRVSSTHIITSFLHLPIQVICFAIPETQTNTHMPRYFEKHAIVLPANLHKSNTGLPIVQWYSLGSNIDDNVSYVLYMSFSGMSKLGCWSCPVRVDNHLMRRSIAIRVDDSSVPIVIVGQENKNQTYISVHHDLHPQLLLKNRSGTKLYCAQLGGENKVVVDDSEHFNWYCTIEDGQHSYYTMPIISERFPELPQTNYSENLVFASDLESDPQGLVWSMPINVTSFNDQFIKLPFANDVKVSVTYSVHTIHVLIESVSQVEISARDIRVRLSQHEVENQNQTKIVKRDCKNDLQVKGSGTTMGSNYYSAEESVATSGSEFLYSVKMEPYLEACESKEHTSSDLYDAEYVDSNHMAKVKDLLSLRMLVFIKSITFTLMSDLENGGVERTEVASLTCDNIGLTLNKAEVSQICLSISDLQIDNQLYGKGSYDFPVLLVGQEIKSNTSLNSLSVPVMQLIHTSQNNCLIKVDVNVETWRDVASKQTRTNVREIKFNIQPLSIYVEDSYMMKLLEYLTELSPPNLVIWPKRNRKVNYKINSISVPMPEHLMFGSGILANPFTLMSFTIEPIAILLSVHSSIKLYIALDQSPLSFGKFDKKRLFTTNYRLGHALTMHYLSGAIFGAGWVVGSLELLGSPGGLARAMGSGLRDFITLPYYGLVQGPWAFLIGVSYGSTSLMKHITAGTLQSITKLASSVARNLDRLSLDEDHLRRTEESRRHRPQGVAQGFIQGLTGLGISLLGAVGGVAHHPLQSIMSDGASPKSLVAGVGKGIVGVFTKPLSGAAELVALTGQGLLQGAGWNTLPEPRMNPVLNHIFSSPNSMLKYKWKFIQSITQSNVLFVTEATTITSISQYEAVALILTSEALVIVDIDEDMSQRVLTLSELTGVSNIDPTLLCLKLDSVKPIPKCDEDEHVEMDPACRARVADYVRTTVGLMQLPDNLSPEHSEMSISPDLTPSCSPNGAKNEETLLSFYVSPQNRNYFLCMLMLAKQQTMNYHFPVL